MNSDVSVPRTASRRRKFYSSPVRCCVVCLFAVAMVWPGFALARQATDESRPLRSVIQDIEQHSAYRFLYRDALISGKSVSVADPATLGNLDQALSAHGLALLVDESRRQVMIHERALPDPAGPMLLRGSVVDDETGARLPFATVSWKTGDRLEGVSANQSGHFDGRIQTVAQDVVVTGSFIGYAPTSVRIPIDAVPSDLTLRLVPRPVVGHEVVVSGTLLHTDLDTTWHRLVRPGILAPLGESSVLRSLQSLPSVSITSAMGSGLVVRGSSSDGFQVLLDGLPIYSQSHFFGLFDAFNDDALQTVGFFYGVTPVSYQAPPGGTVSFLTRTGSQTDLKARVGLSNTSLKGTVEGPIAGGRGSWLLSGRRSYLDAVDWFNNQALLGQGLDVSREFSAPIVRDLPNFVPSVQVREGSADYFDLHGKLYLEGDSGDRLMLSGYIGGDRTSLFARRLVTQAMGMGNGLQAVYRPADTQNDWGNASLGLQLQRVLGASTFTESIIGVTDYNSSFSKADLVTVRADSGQGMGPPLRESHVFDNENRLTEFKAAQSVTRQVRRGDEISAGAEWHHYTTSYREESSTRADFRQNRSSSLVEAYAGYGWRPSAALQADVGLRGHYFALGEFLRWSPRIDVGLFRSRPLSFSLGYSRNHQFLHRISLERTAGSDIWVLSALKEEPGQVDYATAGLYWKPMADVFVQVEGYLKSYENLRLHEAAARERTLSASAVLKNPWLTDSEGRARGLEGMLRYRTGALLWSHAYAWSRMLISNSKLNQGQAFLAEWDQTHQYVLTVEADLGSSWAASATWAWSSGAVNTLSLADPNEADRLDAYHRLDLSVAYERDFGGRAVTARFGLYNAYDRSNTWYRTAIPIIVGTQNGRESTFANVNVYDLGVQPSFELGFSF